jgi:hypothetical protein
MSRLSCFASVAGANLLIKCILSPACDVLGHLGGGNRCRHLASGTAATDGGTAIVAHIEHNSNCV